MYNLIAWSMWLKQQYGPQYAEEDKDEGGELVMDFIMMKEEVQKFVILMGLVR
jgi:hypothetical protein